jgi:hypothetical protein
MSNYMKIRRMETELFRADRQTENYDETNSLFSQFFEKRLKMCPFDHMSHMMQVQCSGKF